MYSPFDYTSNALIRMSVLFPFFLFCNMGDVEKAEHCIRLGSVDCHWHVRRGAVLGIIDEHDADAPARSDGVLQRNFMVDVNGLSVSMSRSSKSFNPALAISRVAAIPTFVYYSIHDPGKHDLACAIYLSCVFGS